MINKKVQDILAQIAASALKANREGKVRLVAASKTKSVQQIKRAYDCGIRNFGENYVEEIFQKQPKLPLDIKWHFIGHLQSNKIKKLMVPNLEYIETVDRISLASKLQKYLSKKDKKLKVLVQVKTSEEQSKNGTTSEELIPLVKHIYGQCPNIQFKGLMTIGKQGDLFAFTRLVHLKHQLLTQFKIQEDQFQLSMGMSGDFEKAIEYGSTSVRVGSSIFGPRNTSEKISKENI